MIEKKNKHFGSSFLLSRRASKNITCILELLVSPLDLISVLLVMPMIQWMIDMHPQGKGLSGTK